MRHKAGGASPFGVARTACFEALAGVFASAGACKHQVDAIDTESSLKSPISRMTYNYYHSSLDDINALDFIRSLENPPMVIFVTAYPEYAVDSYKVNAVDYLLKPYGSEDFQHTAEKAYKHWQLMNSTKVAEQENTEKNVLYLKIHLRAGGPFLTHMTFNQIIEMLPENFVRIHRSYVANMKHVVSAERSCLLMKEGTRLPVSSSRRADLLQYVKCC